jgi:hypothetical protein
MTISEPRGEKNCLEANASRRRNDKHVVLLEFAM